MRPQRFRTLSLARGGTLAARWMHISENLLTALKFLRHCMRSTSPPGPLSIGWRGGNGGRGRGVRISSPPAPSPLDGEGERG